MKFWLKADIQFEAEDLYVACQRIRLHFAEAASAVRLGTPMPPVWYTGGIQMDSEKPPPPKPEAKKK